MSDPLRDLRKWGWKPTEGPKRRPCDVACGLREGEFWRCDRAFDEDIADCPEAAK